MTAGLTAVESAPRPVSSRYDVEGFVTDAGDIPLMTDPTNVRRRSRDFFWYSPVLNRQLHGKSADIIAMPENPLDNIQAVRKVSFVMKDGSVFKTE